MSDDLRNLDGLRRALELLRASRCERSAGIISREIERVERLPDPCRVCGRVGDCDLCAAGRAFHDELSGSDAIGGIDRTPTKWWNNRR